MAQTPERKREYMREYRERYRDKINAQTRKWRADNPERQKALNKSWRQENRAKVRADSKRWREENQEQWRSNITKAQKDRAVKLSRMKTLYGCQICRFRGHRSALDFHHRDRSTKKFLLGGNACGRAWPLIKEELKKCAILCANCHRRVEFGDLTCP